MMTFPLHKLLAGAVIAVALCAWLIGLAGVSAETDARATESDGFRRYEWFLVWFELAALLAAAATTFVRAAAAAHNASLALLVVVTAVSITHTNVYMEILDIMRTSRQSRLPYYSFGMRVVTEKQLQGARAFFAGILTWSACDLALLLLMGTAPAATATATATATEAPAASPPAQQRVAGVLKEADTAAVAVTVEMAPQGDKAA